MIKKIVSGGQSGVDLGGLQAGLYLGLDTGGYAPFGWVTEDGPQEELLSGFGLIECPRPGYTARTEMNVLHSDATLIISHETKLTGGSYSTLCICESLNKPLCVVRFNNPKTNKPIVNDGFKGPGYTVSFPSGSVIDFIEWVGVHGVKVLNVAGPRASKWPDGQSLAMDWLVGQLEGRV